MNEAIGEALVGKPIATFKFVEQLIKPVRVVGVDVARQLAREFDPRVFATRQQSHCPGFERGTGPLGLSGNQLFKIVVIGIVHENTMKMDSA